LRHLRRVMNAQFGASPIDIAQTGRLLTARRLLNETALPITEIAFASGFRSLRRFNAAFAERYRLNPTALRREGDARAAPHDDALRLRLAYRPPYHQAALLGFLGARAMAGIEAARPDGMVRTLALAHRGQALHGWLAWRFLPRSHEVELAIAPALAAATGALVQRARQALDLDAEPERIDDVLASMPPPVLRGIRVPGAFDGFETAVRIILGQQVTVQAARTLTHRLIERFGRPIATPFAELTRLFPSAEAIAEASDDAIGSLGIVRQRIGALKALARAVRAGDIELHRAAPLDGTLARLRELPGIGEWTAQLVAMRVLAWPDAFPASDIGVLNALGTRDPKIAAAMAQPWQPWRSYAVMRLWHTLEERA